MLCMRLSLIALCVLFVMLEGALLLFFSVIYTSFVDYIVCDV